LDVVDGFRVSKLLETPSVKLLLHLYEEGETRQDKIDEEILHGSDSLKIIGSLWKDELIEKRVVPSNPEYTYYSLNDKGIEVASRLDEIKSKVFYGTVILNGTYDNDIYS